MADELTPQEKQEAIDLLREEKKDLATSIGLMKQRNKAMEGVIDVEKDIRKDRRTLSTDINNQVESVQENMMGGVEGFVSDTFGPLGGFINLFTMGFIRRRMANKKLEEENVKETKKQNERLLSVLADRALAAEGITKEETANFENLKTAKIEQIEATQTESEIQQTALKLRQEREEAAAFAEGRQIETIENATNELSGEDSAGGEVVIPAPIITEGAPGGAGGVGGEGGPGGAGGEVSGLEETNRLLKEGFGLASPPYLQTITEQLGGEVARGEEPTVTTTAGGEIDAVSKPGFLMSAEEKVDASFATRDGGGDAVVTEKPGFLMSAEEKVDASFAARGEKNGGEIIPIPEVGGAEESGGVVEEKLTKIEEHLAFIAGNQESAEDRRERLRGEGGEAIQVAPQGEGGKEEKGGGFGKLFKNFKFGDLFKGGGIKKLIATLATTFGSGLTTAFASLGKTFLTTLGPQILKFAGPAALVAGLALAIKDGIAGYFLSDEWGVSKLSGVMGSVLGGTGSGWKNAFANAGKWALIGVGIGAFGGPPGMLIGGIIGAVIGGILGYIGGEDLAKGFDKVGEWFVGIFDTVVDEISKVWHAVMPEWFTNIDFEWSDIFPTGLTKLFNGEYFTVDVPTFHWYSLFPKFLVDWFKGTAEKISEKGFVWTDLLPQAIVDFFTGAIAKPDYKFSWEDLLPTFIVNVIKSIGEAFKETPFTWKSLLPDFIVNLIEGTKIKEGSFEWRDLLPGFITKIFDAGKEAGTTETGEFDWTRLLPGWMGAAWDSTKVLAESAFNWASLLPGWLSAAWGDAKATGKSMLEGTFDWKALLPTWLHGAFDSSVAIKGFAGEGLDSLWGMIKEVFSGLIDKIIALLPGAETVKEVTEAVTETIEGTKQLASDIVEDPVGMAKKGFSAIASALNPFSSDEEEGGGIKGLARGGIVTKPAYLPASGTVVGEHPTWSGKGAAGGGIPEIPDRTGKGEAIIPLDGQRGGAILAEALAPAIAGAILNELMMARVGGGAEGGSAPTVIQDNSTNQNVTNNTIVRTPSPSGPGLHFEGRDFVHKIA